MTDHIAEALEAAALPRSVVAPSYKAKYAARAASNTRRPAVLARGCGDWLHQTLAKATLDKKGKLNRAAFEAILDANGLDPAKWAHRNNGGCRMSGGLALRTVVAEAGTLIIGDEAHKAPDAWCKRILR